VRGWALRFGLAAALACACAQRGPHARIDPLAAREGFERATLDAGDFILTRHLRVVVEAATLVVYLEGDGAAWVRDRQFVTHEPPLIEPFALRLAARDPAPAVAWIGRPCQPVASQDARGCEPSVWSHRRFAEPIVASLDAGLDALRRETGARWLELVGYSGGGVLAALLAARRDDVTRLVTIAAPLDLDAWVAHHGLGPLEARNPARIDAPRLDAVAQTHLVGGRDEIVPPAIVASYGRAHSAARIEIVPDTGHGDWAEGWNKRIACIRHEPGVRSP